jgi:hypothetical protein
MRYRTGLCTSYVHVCTVVRYHTYTVTLPPRHTPSPCDTRKIWGFFFYVPAFALSPPLEGGGGASLMNKTDFTIVAPIMKDKMDVVSFL